MEKQTAIMYDGWIGFCTDVYIRKYLRRDKFKFKSEFIENLICNLKRVYTVNEFIQFVKGIKVKYNSKTNTISIFVNYGDKEFSKKYDFQYNVNDLRIEHEKNYKPVNDMIVEEDGRIRFTGEFRAITRFTAQIFDEIGMYDNKYESDRNDIRVYFEGDMMNGLPEEKGKLVWYDGSLLYEGEFKSGKVTGFGRTYFLNGDLSYEGYRVDGIANGEFVQYFENGQVESKGTMKDGVPIGYGVSYYEDGRLYYKGRYEEDGWAVDGLIHYSYVMDDTGVKFNDSGIYLVDTQGNIKRKLNRNQFEEFESKYRKKKAI